MPAIVPTPTTGNAYIDSLLGKGRWADRDLTYSFPESATAFGTGYGYGEASGTFAPLGARQQQAVQDALANFAAVANLDFTETAETADVQATMRFGLSDTPSTAWAYYPSDTAEGGDVWFNRSRGYYDAPQLGNYAHMTFLHEIGHALGLEHPHQETVMPADGDSIEHSVMSYHSYESSTASGYTNETWGYAQSLMMYDIAAIQHLYGANYDTNASDTVYSWSPFTGEMFVNGRGQGAPGENRIFQTVWDGGGSDTYDFRAYDGDLTINLRPGAWSVVARDQIAQLQRGGTELAEGNIANALLHEGDERSLIENTLGGSGSDRITGNAVANTLFGRGGDDRLNGGSGDDRLHGGSGDDELIGGRGVDTLWGGTGHDVFVFKSATASDPSSCDVIRDFARGQDRIDLRGIDANVDASGDQAFVFIGADAFSDRACELRFDDGLVAGDLNGDSKTDFSVAVLGLSTLAEGDFLL